MKEKKLRGREARLQTIRKNEHGEYRYEGELYAYRDEKSMAHGRAKLAALWAALMAASAAGGLLPAKSMQNSAYVLFPYVVQFISAAALGMALAALFSAGAQVREYQYEAAVKKIPQRALFATLFAVFAAGGAVVSGLLSSFGGYDLLFLCLEAASLACALLLRGAFLKFHWEKVLLCKK